MALTKEFLDSLSFDIENQKYYDAAKVDAAISELKAGIFELLDENEKLRSCNQRTVDEADDLVQKAKRFAESTVYRAQQEAEQIIGQAKQQANETLEKVQAVEDKLQGIDAPVQAGFSASQLDEIERINKQLDELNVMQATMVFRIKQALITMATGNISANEKD